MLFGSDVPNTLGQMAGYSATPQAGKLGLRAGTFPHGALWLAWPRRAAGHDCDVTGDGIRQVVLPCGLVDVKVAAIDDDWSGLKVVWRRDKQI